MWSGKLAFVSKFFFSVAVRDALLVLTTSVILFLLLDNKIESKSYLCMPHTKSYE